MRAALRVIGHHLRDLMNAAPRRVGVPEAFELGLFFGLAFGFAEVVAVLCRRIFFGVPAFDYTAFMAWSTPALGVASFLAIILAPTVMTPGRMRIPYPVAVFLLAGLAGFGFARVVDVGIPVWAAALLGMGVGTRMAAWARDAEGSFRRTVRRGNLIGMTALVLLASAQLVSFAGAGDGTASDGPASDGRSGPNVLLLILDTVRAEELSLYGNPRRTSPVLDSLAREAAVFTRAVAPASYTLPSHAAMFTGIRPESLGVIPWSPLAEDRLTLAEYLAQRGYRTGAFVANSFYGRRYFGLDQGFEKYRDFPLDLMVIANDGWISRSLKRALLEAVDLPAWRGRFRSAERINEEFLAWIDGEGEEPFFAFLNYMDAHAPYHPPDPYFTIFTGSDQPFHDVPDVSAPEELRQARATYAGGIRYLDASIGDLLAELKYRGLLDNTLLIVTSDHGEQFGEHGLIDHANSLYMDVLHVPLVLRLPKVVPAGTRVAEAVSLLDLPRTISDLVGAGSAVEFRGSSWRALLTSGSGRADTLRRSPILSEGLEASERHVLSLLRDTLHYIHRGDGSAELFNLAADPEEAVDVADREGMSAVVGAFAARASALMAAPVEPGTEGERGRE